MTTIQSFSGAHPYRPQCVIDDIVADWARYDIDARSRAIDLAEAFTQALEAGKCPRCNGPLDPERVAGSRVTPCRCVPICPTCGSDEAYQAVRGTGLSPLWKWPVRKGDMTRRRNKVLSGPGVTIDLCTLTSDSDGEPVVISEEGVGRVVGRPHPGGWAEYGYDDTEDEAERTR